MQPELKTFLDYASIEDAWSVESCSGMPEANGDSVVNVQRFNLKFLTEKKFLTPEIFAYYMNTGSWDAAEIKARLVDGELFVFPDGSWKNNGFSFSGNGREALCTLVIEMRS